MPLDRVAKDGETDAGQKRSNLSPRPSTLLLLVVVLVVALILKPVLQHLLLQSTNYGILSRDSLTRVESCTLRSLRKSDLTFLDGVTAIESDEFRRRRDRLAAALAASDLDAFVVEPGYTFQYYVNISQPDWEPWEPEERPFLMVIMPETSGSGKISARTSFLAPHFEEGRVRTLRMPVDVPLDIVVWEEHWDPFATLRDSHLFQGLSRPPKVMVDEELRDFISRGLSSVGFETVGLSPEIELVRQIKSPAEVDILRAVNTGTVAAVRAMRPCLETGLTENQVRDILNAALESLGFSKFFNVVLFEENAALPHGGFATGGKKLEFESMILIDVGAHYLGYSSDICRSFFIDPQRSSLFTDNFRGPWIRLAGWLVNTFGGARHFITPCPDSTDELHGEKLKVWDIVLEAQTAAAAAFRPNNSAASVDLAARSVIEVAGYEESFTHRVGHGLGIKAHESPYLNKWNKESLLLPGMVFTNEPGIYLTGKFGVRHEDVYLVTESEEADLLTGARAMGPFEP